MVNKVLHRKVEEEHCGFGIFFLNVSINILVLELLNLQLSCSAPIQGRYFEVCILENY